MYNSKGYLRLNIPRNKKIVIELMDNLIEEPIIQLPDAKTSRIFGMYVEPWRKKGIIGIYADPLLKESIAKLKVKDVEKRVGVGGRIEYLIDDSILYTRVKIPEI